MNVIETSIPGVVILEPRVFGDARGYFFESWSQRDLDAALGRHVEFVQDNESKSRYGVVRGVQDLSCRSVTAMCSSTISATSAAQRH